MEKTELFLKAMLIALVIDLIVSLPVMWLWNLLMPSIFGLTQITFWQALGINILTDILFKASIKM